MTLSLFFNCIACKGPLNPLPPPLCGPCSNALDTASPSLCSRCGSPFCPLQRDPHSCLRPWVTRPQIHSFSTRYLLIGRRYETLRRWKICSGLAFDHSVLRPDEGLTQTWENFQPDAIVPIPQAFRRSWKMGGSRAVQIGRWVARQLGKPLIQPLFPPQRTKNEKAKRQAELTLEERLQNSIRFGTRPHELEKLGRVKRVILIDDFMTTGRTLQKGAEALNSMNVEAVHVFCLGVRVLNLNSQSSPHLEKRLRGAEAIGEKRDSS